MNMAIHQFPLAPMSSVLRLLTIGLLVLSFIFLWGALFQSQALWVPTLLLLGIYAWVWLWFRPTQFVVHAETLEIIWPLRRRHLRCDSMIAVRPMTHSDLEREVGWCIRIGAGRLWGGFGWLWTQRRGLIAMYILRTDGLVWLERQPEQPWLITPEHPAVFVETLSR
jgi:hypothetical protein